MIGLGLGSAILASNTSSPFLFLSFAFIALSSGKFNPISMIWGVTILGCCLYYGIHSLSQAMLAGTLLLLPITAMHSRESIFPLLIVCLFSLGLIAQLFSPELLFAGARASLPMQNPNNAGALINLFLIYSTLKIKDKIYIPISIILLMGLLATGCKAALLSYMIVIGGYLFFTYGKKVKICLFLASIIPIAFLISHFDSLSQRLPIWEGAYKLIGGHGIGRYKFMYPEVRVENYTSGNFPDNDLLMFLIELGYIPTIIFIGLIGYIVKKTTRENLIPALAMLGVLVHSLVDYPFYVPAVSIGMGYMLYLWLENGIITPQYNLRSFVMGCKKGGRKGK